MSQNASNKPKLDVEIPKDIELDDPSIELTKERYIIPEKKQALMDAVR